MGAMAVAMKVRAGTTTEPPSRLKARAIISKAAVPLWQPTAKRAPMNSAKELSNRRQWSPMARRPDRRASVKSSQIALASSSSNGIFRIGTSTARPR
jgi:hypothetical protein